jgi:type IV secretion system protein VirB5
MIYLASHSTAEPYYIEVDKTGVVGNITKGTQNYDVKESSVEYFLGQTISKMRTVPRDQVQYRKNWDTALYFMTKSASKKLDELMKDEHPIEDIKKGLSTDVNIIGVSKMAGKNDVYQVRWQEKAYDKNELKKEVTMNATMTVVLSKPKQEENILENPFGIYIDDISWSKER